jgi:hypothetical protein
MTDYQIRGLPDEETSPADGDYIAIDDVGGTKTKKLSWANIKATLKTYLDTLYATLTHATRHTDGNDDIRNATDSLKGLATAAQITKLDSVDANADVTGSNTPQNHATGHTDGSDDIRDATNALKGVATSTQITALETAVSKLSGIEALAEVSRYSTIGDTDGTGWKRVAYLDYASGRGSHQITIYVTGGSWNPELTSVIWSHDWGGGASVSILHDTSNALWDAVRVTNDGAGVSYLEFNFTDDVSDVRIELKKTGLYSGGLYSGTLPTGGDDVDYTMALSGNPDNTSANTAADSLLLNGEAGGVSDNNVLTVDDVTIATDDYAKFTVNGLKGVNYTVVRSNLNVDDGADVTGSNAPQAHKTSHQNVGGDEISVAGLSGLLADDQHVLDAEVVTAAKTVKLDEFTVPTDITTLNATTGLHGLLPKLGGGETDFLRADGTWAVPVGSGGIPAGYVGRSKFTYKDSNELYIGAGNYHHAGTVDQEVYWDAQLTKTVFGTLGGWGYLYIDDSRIVTLGSNELTEAEFLMSITAPVWSHTKHGWYSGLDRCIFACKMITASTHYEFFHNGDKYMCYADRVVDYGQDVDIPWENVLLDIPAFTRSAECTIRLDNTGQGAVSSSYWRTDNQLGAVGHHVAGTDSDGKSENWNDCQVETSATQYIEVSNINSSGHYIYVYTNGYYLPEGM